MQPSSTQKSARLFKSSLLERLTRTHIAVPITLFILYSGTLLYWSLSVLVLHPLIVLLLFLVGLITFTWIEYQVHRRIFHLETTKPWKAKFQHTIHGVHHDHPKDRQRLAMPPVLSLLIATTLLLILKAIMGDFTFAFLPGFLTGYASYLLVHYVIHVFSPPSNRFRILWINHSIHHYKDSSKAFGVSSPLWDYIYGTQPK